MKKTIKTTGDFLSKFQASEISALSSITGGVKGSSTTTLGYNTASAADDPDKNEHDNDGA